MIQIILYNGNIITLEPTQPRVSALAISYGRVVALGTDDEIRALANTKTTEVNLDGKTVLPGLTDAHLHWEWTSRALKSVDVFELPSKQIALDRVKARVDATATGEWITGWGWAQDMWEDRAFPTKADLDAVAPNHPVMLSAKSGHAGWANSKALKQAGIINSTPDPEGGQIQRDANGEATGILLESAMGLVAKIVPSPTPNQLADMMTDAQQRALKSGLTMIHDFDEPSCLSALQILRERGDLSIRALKNVNQQWLSAAIESGIRTNFGDDWIRIGALKLFADGALGPKTALMFEPFEGEPDNYGIAVVDKEEMVEYVSRASACGLPSTVHAIGDKAVHDVLDVFEHVRAEETQRGIARSKHRHRIEHVQIIHPQDLDRLAQLDIIASMQPIHATSDMVTADRHWGTERTQYSYNPRLQLNRGARIAFGSDAPVEPFDPFMGIHAAITRQRNGLPVDGWHPSAKLTLDETLLGFTQGPAYAANMENRLGKLAEGFLADLIVIDRDIYAIESDEILDINVLGTMVDGEWRYRDFE
jgi:predicted amidohydrolase YtcJ